MKESWKMETNNVNVSLYKFGWVLLVILLFASTFGTWFSFVLLVYMSLFTTGFVLVLGYWGFTKSQAVASKTQGSNLGFPPRGLEKILVELQHSRSSYKLDKRLTGSSIIDEPLQEVLQLFFRDYVHSWYYTSISSEEGFLHDLRHTLQRALIASANRSKDVEWVTFLTTRFVDDITNHLKIYRKAKEALDKTVKAEGEENLGVDIETLFFQTEHKMEGDICRDKICMSEEKEYDYLCDISEVLLFLLLPPEDFHNKPFRYFFREIIARCVLVPTVSLICDPDYIYQTVAWLCKDSTFTREAFLTIIREGLSSVEDVESVRNKVDVEIAKLRAHDSETSEAADAAVRQQLSSLLFVRRLCEAKIQTLKYGHGEVPAFLPEQSDLGKLIVPNQPVPTLSLQTILDDNTALSYFIEFMNGVNGQVYLYFWLAVEGYRVTAEQQLSVTAEQQMALQEQVSSGALEGQNVHSSTVDLEALRSAALSLFEQYLSDSADPRVTLPKDLVKQTHKRITKGTPSPDYFDDAQSQVYEVLGNEKFYGAFINSQTYLRCLLDLDILNEKSDDGGDTASNIDEDEARTIDMEATPAEECAPHPDRLWSPDDDVRLNASITEVGMCKDNSGRIYAVYSVSVFRTTAQGTQSWTVYRRYSDFDNLHMHLKEKFGSFDCLLLPTKKTFNNMDKKFLEKRRIALNSYLQNLLLSDLLGRHPGMFEIVFSFLEPGEYTREKMQFARKLVAPIRNVSHAIKTVPGGVQKMFTKPGGHRRELKEDSRQLYADFDPEEEENIPLRILLLLMDEIFDLKDRNLWLRRRIVVLLRQIIKTTFGDRINRKIVDFVDFMTSAEQIAEYVKVFRDSFWPGGVLAETPPERKLDAKTRTRVAAKTKMYGSIPEELNRFLGTDVTMAGVCRVFDTFQYTSFNKRLFYVFWEGILEQLFPDNKFNEIFRKIHAKAK